MSNGKAICTKRLINNFPFIAIKEGEVVNYHVENRNFIVSDVAMFPPVFFEHFKVTEGFDKMTYSDFEYILCNYVFGMAVLFTNEYDGVRHLVIQDTWKGTIMINVNKEENVIRISFPDEQNLYTSYEDALEAIRNHKWS